MIKSKRVSRIFLSLFIVAFIISASSLSVSAAPKKVKVSASTLNDGFQFTFDGMPSTSSSSPIKTYKGKTLGFSGIQNFDITPDGKYIFTTSKCYTGSDMHTMLTRCIFPRRTGTGATAAFEDVTILGNYGHGEVLAITQDDTDVESYNLWVGCDPEKKVDRHATSIARLTYEIDSEGKGQIVKTVKIKGFKNANVKNGKAAYFRDKVSPKWVIAAVDESSNQIVFRLRFPDGYGCTYLSYDFDKINNALNKLDNKGVYQIKKAAKWQRARIRWHRSIQSFDVDGNNLYVADGLKGTNAHIYVMHYKKQSNKKLSDQNKTDNNCSKIITIIPKITIKGVKYTKKDLEIEGIKVNKLSNGKINYYFNFLRAGTGLRDTQSLHMITK